MNKQNVRAKRRRARRRLHILIAAGSVVALIVLAILIDSALYYNKIHTGVSVGGQSVGGLMRDEATAALNRMVDEAQESPIVLVSGNLTWEIMPSDVGTKIDVASAVDAAMDVTRESNFIIDLGRRLKLYFSDTDIPLEGTVNNSLLEEAIDEVAQDLDVPPVDAGLAIENGKITVVEGNKGTVVDRDTLREELKALLFTLHATELEVPMVVKEPEVQADAHEAARGQAQVMISAPVKLVNGDDSWTLSPEDIVAYMDFTAKEQNGVSTLVPYLSAEKLDHFFATIADQVATKAVNASFDSDGNKAWVVPGAPGKALDREKTAEAITAASYKISGRTAQVEVKTSEPDLTTEEAEAMGVKDKLAGYTTEYGGSANRQINVKITTKYASDVMLAPGETYNFDKQIGPRTAERGYKTAPGIVGPGKLEDVFGGGICQVSTTLFNAALLAGLPIIERKNHSIYIDHYPKGRDATVSAGSPNLRFKNDTDHYIWIRGASDGVTTTFNIYGTKDGRKVKISEASAWLNVVEQTQVTVTNPQLPTGTSLVQTEGQKGKQCSVTRTITWPDGTKKTNEFVSTYPMIPKTIEVGTGSTTTTTVKPSSTTSTTSGPPPSSTTLVTEF